MNKIISSTTNPLIKSIALLLEKPRARKESGLFVVEGRREIEMALKGGYRLKTLLFEPEIFDPAIIGDILTAGAECIEVTGQVYQKLAYRESTEGVIGVFEIRDTSLESVVTLMENPVIFVTEAPEKPGNIGAMLRTADAAGVGLFVVANPTTDIYNPNIIRASLGALFTTRVATASTQEVIAWLKAKGFRIFCAYLSAKSVPYYHVNFNQPCAIVVGTEAEGLTKPWVENADENIIIPMHGSVDSMNVSVSGAILLFEALRQRAVK